MTILLTFISVFVLSWLGVGLFRKWSRGRLILDVPNERSSHQRPTPVGGGLLIVLFTLLPLLAFELFTTGAVSYWGFYAGGALIAIVSWIDDIRPVSPILRLSVHILAAMLAVFQIGGFQEFTVWPGYTVALGLFGTIISGIWVVWLTNAYNFMDGIDGIAGVQAVVASAAWALYAAYHGPAALLFVSILVLASSTGFLLHNWPPAKVFMGDVGSAFLGFSFAVFPLMAVNSGNAGIQAGFLPLTAIGFVWLFMSDTIVTLIRRALIGEMIWNAHRKHLYQELIKSGYTHLRVTMIYGALMLIVAASALLEIQWRVFGLTLASGAIALIVVSALVIKGKKSFGGDT